MAVSKTRVNTTLRSNKDSSEHYTPQQSISPESTVVRYAFHLCNDKRLVSAHHQDLPSAREPCSNRSATLNDSRPANLVLCVLDGHGVGRLFDLDSAEHHAHAFGNRDNTTVNRRSLQESCTKDDGTKHVKNLDAEGCATPGVAEKVAQYFGRVSDAPSVSETVNFCRPLLNLTLRSGLFFLSVASLDFGAWLLSALCVGIICQVKARSKSST